MPPFTRIPDFDDTSARKGRCYILNIPRPEEDEGVFRGPMIDFEGFMDVSERAIKEAASELGWISAEKAKEYKDACLAALKAEAERQVERDDYKRRLQDMIMENAELVTEVQRWRAWGEEDSEVDDEGNIIVSLDALIEDELSS